MENLIELPVSQLPVVLLITAGLLIWSRTTRRPLQLRPILLAGCIFLAGYVLLVLGASLSSILPVLARAKWNWLGKIFSIAFSFVIIVLSSRLNFRKVVGTFRLTEIFSWTPLVWAAVAIVLIGGSVGFFDNHGTAPDVETLLYQSTLPGLDEELLYRGVLLSLFIDGLHAESTSFGDCWIAGLCTSLMFGSVHGVSFENHGFHVDPFYFAFTAIMGMLLVWLRIRSKSLVLPVIAHNAINVLDYSDVFLWQIAARAIGL